MSPLAHTPTLITIPAATFQMGEGEDAHAVKLPAFQIGRYPVTAVQYEQFVADAGWLPPPDWRDVRAPAVLADHPVTSITWQAARAYCRWLGDGYRLPSEAEWEYAARGPNGRAFPWGDVFDKSKCNNWEGGAGYTTAVTTFLDNVSPFGVCDTAGNVWEWTSTLFCEYPYVGADGREDPDADGWRVLRGGSWYDTDWGVRAARRLGSPPHTGTHNTGFRVARDV